MTQRAVLPPGLVPRYLSREEAAGYVGVSPNVFEAEVRQGYWPPARRRGAREGRLTWDRVLLDLAADRWAGIVHAPAQDSPAQPDGAAGDLAALEQQDIRRVVAQRGTGFHQPNSAAQPANPSDLS